MTLVIVLFAAGIALLAADVFAVSFVLAACGGLAMAIGTAVVDRDYGTGPAVASGVGAVLLLVGTVVLEVFWLPRTRLGRGLVVQSTSGAKPTPAGDAALVGKAAQAVTTLAPSGYVLIDGRRYEAFCQSGLAQAGAELRVIGHDQFRVIVTDHPL